MYIASYLTLTGYNGNFNSLILTIYLVSIAPYIVYFYKIWVLYEAFLFLSN